MIAFFFVLSVLGCARYECRQTCDRLYGDGEGSCGFELPATTPEDLTTECIATCEAALKTPGEADGYDPNVRTEASQSVEIENRAQVQLWMDCIAETSCENLDEGYCAPIW